MKINHTYKDMITGAFAVYQIDDATSPKSGFTQSYLDRSGKECENEARRQHDNDYLEWFSSELA